MASYRYQAVTAGGAPREGVIEAATPRAARDELRAQGLLPVAIEASLPESGAATERARLPASEIALLTRQIATLLAAATPLEETLAAVAGQSESPRVREVLQEVRNDVLAGRTLAAALARFPRCFGDFYCGLVSVGGETGRLSAVMAKLADYLDARQALKQKVLLALLYPTLVALIALAVIIALLTYVMPQVVAAFEHTRQTLPLLTRGLIALSGFLRDYGWVLVLFMFGLGAAAAYAWRREELRQRAQAQLLRLPMIGRLVVSLDAARFASTLAILVGSGAPLLRSLDAAAGVMWLLPLRAAARDAASRVREGVGLARALDAAKVFPPLFLQLVASGEASGRLPDLLQRAAVQQQQEAERRLGLLVGLLEPALILVMGGVVLLMVLAVMMPIVSMNQLIR